MSDFLLCNLISCYQIMLPKALKAKKGVFLGFFSLLVLTLLTQIDILFIPNNEDFSQEAMKTLFTLTPRICFGSMIAYFISNSLNFLILFDKYKKNVYNEYRK